MTGGPSTLGFIGLGVMGGRMCPNLYSPVIYRLLER